MKPKVLYHGSHKKLELLNAFESPPNDGKFVYASPFYEFALCYCGNRWRDDVINQSFYNNELYITEIKEGSLELFNTYGYIHILDGKDFNPYGSTHIIRDGFVKEYVSIHPQKPKKILKIPNVLKEMYKSNIHIYEYPNLPPFIPNRVDYLIERERRMKQFQER